MGGPVSKKERSRRQLCSVSKGCAAWRQYPKKLLVIVSVVVVVVSVAMVFMFVEPAVIANVVVVIPLVVMIYAPPRAIPVPGEVAATLVARANPMSADIGGAAPIALMPIVVPGDGVPVARNPERLRFGLRRHYHHGARRGWSGDLDADGNLSFGGNAGQQKSGKGGDLEQRFHGAMFSSDTECLVVPGLSPN